MNKYTKALGFAALLLGLSSFAPAYAVDYGLPSYDFTFDSGTNPNGGDPNNGTISAQAQMIIAAHNQAALEVELANLYLRSHRRYILSGKDTLYNSVFGDYYVPNNAVEQRQTFGFSNPPTVAHFNQVTSTYQSIQNLLVGSGSLTPGGQPPFTPSIQTYLTGPTTVQTVTTLPNGTTTSFFPTAVSAPYNLVATDLFGNSIGNALAINQTIRQWGYSNSGSIASMAGQIVITSSPGVAGNPTANPPILAQSPSITWSAQSIPWTQDNVPAQGSPFYNQKLDVYATFNNTHAPVVYLGNVFFSLMERANNSPDYSLHGSSQSVSVSTSLYIPANMLGNPPPPSPISPPGPFANPTSPLTPTEFNRWQMIVAAFSEFSTQPGTPTTLTANGLGGGAFFGAVDIGNELTSQGISNLSINGIAFMQAFDPKSFARFPMMLNALGITDLTQLPPLDKNVTGFRPTAGQALPNTTGAGQAVVPGFNPVIPAGG